MTVLTDLQATLTADEASLVTAEAALRALPQGNLRNKPQQETVRAQALVVSNLETSISNTKRDIEAAYVDEVIALVLAGADVVNDLEEFWTLRSWQTMTDSDVLFSLFSKPSATTQAATIASTRATLGI